MYDVAYSIRNVATRKYLGMKLGDPVKDRDEVCEVEQVFPWDVRGDSPLQWVQFPQNATMIS
jgi:hypothetical protein